MAEKFVTVTILMPQELRLKFQVDGNWTVLDLKTKIEELSKIPSKDQILVGESNEAPILNDDTAILETLHPWATNRVMNVTLWTKLVEPEMLEVPVFICRRSRNELSDVFYEPLTVKVESSASVKQLKMKIDEMKGIAPGRQELVAHLNTVPPNPIMDVLDSHILEDMLCAGLNKTYRLILKKASRGHTIPINVLVPSIGIGKTLKMDVESDTVFTLRAKLRKHLLNRFLKEDETFQLYTGVNREIPLVIGSAVLMSYQIDSITEVYVELDLEAARLLQFASLLED